MNSHQLRFLLIAVITAIVLIGQIIVIVADKFDTVSGAILSGALAVLLPALVDASAVERRRRNPNKAAVEDDTGDVK